MIRPLTPGTYIVAVSGGVDSMVLLDILKDQQDVRLIVAHLDHGIREDSHEDAQLVEEVAKRHGLTFCAKRVELGEQASEDSARQARYSFLNELKNQHDATAIITAHHGDDVVETMVINILRGTGWRGICALQDSPTLIRPLLGFRKKEIIEYAQKHRIKWHEDSTNLDQSYLRNFVRHKIISDLDYQKWRQLYEEQVRLQQEIDKEVALLTSQRRYNYICWPKEVSIEILRSIMNLTRPQASRALLAIKTSKNNTLFQAGDGQSLRFTRDAFVVEAATPC